MPTSSLARTRFATLLCPPVGLLLLWRDPALSLGRKLLGTLGILLFCILYAALMIFILMTLFGLAVEWRGGFPPVLTFSKTVPNYEAVERHRSQQTNHASAPASGLPVATNAYWTDFRGPRRDGHYTEQPILTNWPAAGPRLLWRQPVGGGYASFVVAGGLAFTIEQRRHREAVTAYDLATGREVWAHTYEALFQESMGGDGSRATPTYHEGRLYSLGAQGDFHCLEALTGNVIWSRNILRDHQAENLMYGMSAAPLIVNEKVIVLPGGLRNESVAAYHKETGQPVWKSLPDQTAYVSPMLVTLAGQRQLLVVSATRAVGLKVEDGSLLWEFPWRVQYDNNIAQPVLLSSNRFLLSAGYGTGCVAVEVNRTEAGFTARSLWRNKFLKNKFSSSVFWEGYIYGLDEDILTCLDAATGQRQWKDGRYGYGQLLLASGHLVILSGEGELALVKASPAAREERARFPALQGKTWNHPTIAGNRLLVRNAVEMACFDLAP